MNLTRNGAQVYNSTVITDEILTMLQLPKQDDEKKFLSGILQSWRGVNLTSIPPCMEATVTETLFSKPV
jgi:hypothetical protein